MSGGSPPSGAAAPPGGAAASSAGSSHILDVPGLSVGHAADGASGTTAVVFGAPVAAGVAVHGAAPGTRETDALSPANLGPAVDAIVLSGGSAFGLAAADGAMAALARAGRGFAVAAARIPIVPAAIVFDVYGPLPDYRALGEAAVTAALSAPDRRIGSVGAGTGATVAGLKGGIGSASARVGEWTVGAIVVANAVGSVTAADGPWFRAAPFETDGEFGGLHAPPTADFAAVVTKLDARSGANTVIGLVATDATLTRGECAHLARVAHDGIALATYPAHTILDGDTVFAVTTGRLPGPAKPRDSIGLTAAAAVCVARALTLAVFHATAAPGDRLPTWRERWAP